MIQFIFLASLLIPSLLIPSDSWGQQIRVEKVKGNKAMVEFSGNLVPGKSYSMTESDSSGSRKYLFGGSLSYVSSNYTISSLNTSVKHHDTNLSMRFGWNNESFELGPVFGYRNADSDFADQHYSAFTGGLFADYNFTPNRSGEKAIFGVTSEGVFGSLTPETGTSGTTMELSIGAFFKWFGFTDSTALRADLGYDYVKTNAGASSNTFQGIVFRGGIATYF